MLKSSSQSLWQSRLVLRSLPSRSRSLPSVRLASSVGGQSGGGGGSGKLIVGSLVTITGLVGGTIGYASYDKEFRNYVEDLIPGTRESFAVILGEDEDAKKKPLEAPPSKLKTPSAPPMKVTSLPPKVEDKKAAVQESPAATKNNKFPPNLALTPPAPPLDPPPPVTTATSSVTKAEEVKAKAGEAENISLTLSLEEACRTMETMADMAITAGDKCKSAIRNHMTLVQRVLEINSIGDRDDKSWNQVFEAANDKSEALKKSMATMNEAKAAVKRVLESIEVGKKDPLTSESPSLALADEKVNDVLVKLEQTRVALEAAQKEAFAVDRYRDMIEEGRHQFQKEISAILPHVNLSSKDGSHAHLSEEELNLFMTHAYQKVSQLQQELARWKTLEHERSEQSARATMATEELVQSELTSQRRDLELEHQRRMSALRNEMESEMRSQLRRQAAAHSDHISDVLEVQKKELDRLNARIVDEAVTSEKSTHKQELAKIIGKIAAIEKNMELRGDMDAATRDAQALWLATVALNVAITNAESKTSTVNLKEAVDRLAANFGNDEFVSSVLQSLPKQIKSNEGIPSEAAIKDRFFRVEKLAQRTALVGEEGGSLLRYALSYLQSLFILSPSRENMPDNQVPIDVESLSTFDIIWLARGSLERGDLDQAVRYMSLLKGMPAKVSSDWLADARLVLETQLACRALLVHAAALGGEVFPPKQ